MQPRQPRVGQTTVYMRKPFVYPAFKAGQVKVFSCKQWFDQHVVALVAQIKRKKVTFSLIQNLQARDRIF